MTARPLADLHARAGGTGEREQADQTSKVGAYAQPTRRTARPESRARATTRSPKRSAASPHGRSVTRRADPRRARARRPGRATRSNSSLQRRRDAPASPTPNAASAGLRRPSRPRAPPSGSARVRRRRGRRRGTSCRSRPADDHACLGAESRCEPERNRHVGFRRQPVFIAGIYPAAASTERSDGSTHGPAGALGEVGERHAAESVIVASRTSSQTSRSVHPTVIGHGSGLCRVAQLIGASGPWKSRTIRSRVISSGSLLRR